MLESCSPFLFPFVGGILRKSLCVEAGRQPQSQGFVTLGDLDHRWGESPAFLAVLADSRAWPASCTLPCGSLMPGKCSSGSGHITCVHLGPGRSASFYLEQLRLQGKRGKTLLLRL